MVNDVNQADLAHLLHIATARANLDPETLTWPQQIAALKADPETLAAFERLLALDKPDLPLEQWAEDWPTFWATDHRTEQFLCAPILAEGRGHALYAPAKTGKSLLTLEMCAAIATGRPFLDMPARKQGIKVLIIDYEMTPDDLSERLTRFGYGPRDDLSNLRYVRMPAIGPLDTVEGGQAVIQDAIPWGAQLVVVDTQARAVSGDENAAETTRDFYRHTLMPLKSSGITTLRVDHAGKDLGKGMRGSSSKADDVDIVWKLTADTNRYTLTATHRRIGWVPETVQLIRHETYPMHRHAPPDEPEPPPSPEVLELVGRLDAADIPTDHGRDRVRGAGIAFRNDQLAAAQRWRQARAIDNVARPAPDEIL